MRESINKPVPGRYDVMEVGKIEAYIDMEKCPSLEEYCEPMRKCPLGTIHREQDDSTAMGWRTYVDSTKCDGCGLCVDLCCGGAIEIR